MEITLIRHGKVDYPPITRLSSAELAAWIDAYNSNALDKTSQPPEDTQKVARGAHVVVCSDLPRSIESALVLGVDNIFLSDELFNEAGLPFAQWKYPKLSVRIWSVVFRVAWLFGYSNNAESIKEAKGRASLAANKLIELATAHQSVAFIGHGVINHFIASELRSEGWLGSKSPGRNNWEYGIYKIKSEG